MYAVVQIGSRILRSDSITTFKVVCADAVPAMTNAASTAIIRNRIRKLVLPEPLGDYATAMPSKGMEMASRPVSIRNVSWAVVRDGSEYRHIYRRNVDLI